MIANLINGNLDDAKRQAREFSERKIRQYCQEQLYYSSRQADLIAGYLKGTVSWDEYCQGGGAQ